MKYRDFKKTVERFPVISSSQLGFLDENRQAMRNQLSRWLKQGLIVKLRKGLYALNESDRKIEPSKHFLANLLYSPSYLSLEYALGFYDLIPERVADMTSVTTKKTFNLSNGFGAFVYQHIHPRAFTGFTSWEDENGYAFFVALPEKAVVDLLYLNLSLFQESADIFEESFRFQNTERLKRKKIMEFAALFNSKKLTAVSMNFCRFIRRSE